jgi:transcriptional regulator with XRE-family HTH domain
VNPTRIEQIARAKGMTQEDLAKGSGVTHSTVRRLWRDRDYREDPRMSTMRAIARFLQVSVTDLGYADTDVKSPDSRMSLARVAV